MAQQHPAAQTRIKFIAELDPVVTSEVERAINLMNYGNLQAGKIIIQRLLDNHPTNHMVVYAKGLCHAQERQLDEAIAAFESAIQIYPYFEEAYFNLGIGYKQKINLPKAVAAFRKTIEVGDPRDVFVTYARSEIKNMTHLIFQHYKLPLNTYLKSQELFEEGFDAMQGKNFEQAISLFNACLAILDNHPQCYGNIGICYGRLGRKDEALEALNHALAIDPAYEPAIVNRAIIERLKEGEVLSLEMQVTEYYKDYTAQNKSYIESHVIGSEMDGQSDRRLGFVDDDIK